MTVDEMINFNISDCMTQIAKETDLKIVNGVYSISCEVGLEFNKEEIKKLLLMFKPMQKELETYKKALELAAQSLFGDNCDFRHPECDDLSIYQIPCQKCIECIVNDFLKKAKED